MKRRHQDSSWAKGFEVGFGYGLAVAYLVVCGLAIAAGWLL